MNYVLLMQAQLDIMNGLFEAAEAENRAFTEDEQTKYDNAEQEFNRLKASKEKADALKALRGQIPEEQVHTPASNAASHSNQISVGGERSTQRPYSNLGQMLHDVAGAKNNRGESLDRLKNANLLSNSSV